MRIRLPIMIQDPTLSGHKALTRIVERPYLDEEGFTDGPACARVAVDDVDLATGEQRPKVAFLPPRSRCTLWRYDLASEQDIYAPNFVAVTAFGTVLRTMHMFEEPDTLGRRLTWAFDGPQLLLVPRAAEKIDARYQRLQGRLLFCYFPNPRDTSETIYTALSRDIVAHETGHAILDGIAPHLLGCATPQSRALHEAIADLVAAVMAFRSRALCEAILKETQGSIADVSAFSSIAEEFGMALQNVGYLRDLRNSLHMDDVDHTECHSLSQVLSAALYLTILGMHERWWRKFSGDSAAPDVSTSGKALAVAASHFKRMIFRPLDYLPPAEISFADYGRALLAADQASHPDDDEERQFIRAEFVRRGIVANAADLDVQTDYAHPALADVDIPSLVESDQAATAFVAGNRELFHIPPDVPFAVESRRDVTKLYYHRGGRRKQVRECLIKVQWLENEPNPLGAKWPPLREAVAGTTLAVDWNTRRVRALLTTDRRARPHEDAALQEERTALLRRWAESGILRRGGPQDNEPGVVHVNAKDGVMCLSDPTDLLRAELT